MCPINPSGRDKHTKNHSAETRTQLVIFPNHVFNGLLAVKTYIRAHNYIIRDFIINFKL